MRIFFGKIQNSKILGNNSRNSIISLLLMGFWGCSQPSLRDVAREEMTQLRNKYEENSQLFKNRISLIISFDSIYSSERLEGDIYETMCLGNTRSIFGDKNITNKLFWEKEGIDSALGKLGLDLDVEYFTWDGANELGFLRFSNFEYVQILFRRNDSEESKNAFKLDTNIYISGR